MWRQAFSGLSSVRLPHGPFYVFTTRVDVVMGRAEASPGRQGSDRTDPQAPTASASNRALLPVNRSQGGLPRHRRPAAGPDRRVGGKPFIAQGGLGGTGGFKPQSFNVGGGGVENTAQLEPQELPDITPYLTNSPYQTLLISGWVILLQGI